MASKCLFGADLGFGTLRFTPDFDCEEEKDRKKIGLGGDELAIFFVF